MTIPVVVLVATKIGLLILEPDGSTEVNAPAVLSDR
jgi:hypothetical protein